MAGVKGMKRGKPRLTAIQARYAENVIRNGDPSLAAKIAGYKTPAQAAYANEHNEAMLATIREAQRNFLVKRVGPLANDYMERLLTVGFVCPDAVKVKAAIQTIKWIREDALEAQSTNLSEKTPEELNALLDRIEEIAAGAAKVIEASETSEESFFD
jgi:hypothetical protein